MVRFVKEPTPASDLKIVQDVVMFGCIGPHPKWTKEECLERCRKMYEKFEAVRRYLIRQKIK